MLFLRPQLKLRDHPMPRHNSYGQERKYVHPHSEVNSLFLLKYKEIVRVHYRYIPILSFHELCYFVFLFFLPIFDPCVLRFVSLIHSFWKQSSLKRKFRCNNYNLEVHLLGYLKWPKTDFDWDISSHFDPIITNDR